MTEFLTVSRAARLVGVTRGALQKRIRDNELQTFEGMVKVSDLLRAFPEAHLEDDSALERVNRIKAAAMPRWEATGELPPPEVLATRVARLSRELTEAKAELGNHSALVGALGEKLAALDRCEDGRLRAEVRALTEWLEREIEHRPKIPKRAAALLAKDTFLRVLAAQVKVIPSGREFFVEGTDSILEAAVRAGLAPCYGCDDGSCGSCKARVVTGEVLKVRDHDYEISATEHNLGYVLMCSYTAVTDLTIEAAQAHRGEDIPQQTITARVKEIARPTENLAILTLRTPKSQRLRFLAGQRVALTLEDGASDDLPLASCPCDGGNLEFHVYRRAPSSFVDAVLGGRVQLAQPVTVSGPHGNFLLREDAPNPILFLAYDEGFGPIKSLIESAVSMDNAESYHLVWLTSTSDGHYMDNRCRAWTDALDNFRYTPVVHGETREHEHPAGTLAGELAGIGDIAQYEVYAAGPEMFLGAVRDLLVTRGVPLRQVHLERTR
jgi:CDP-4-dehydro-6-deoxyglucose reductase, E3